MMIADLRRGAGIWRRRSHAVLPGFPLTFPFPGSLRYLQIEPAKTCNSAAMTNTKKLKNDSSQTVRFTKDFSFQNIFIYATRVLSGRRGEGGDISAVKLCTTHVKTDKVRKGNRREHWKWRVVEKTLERRYEEAKFTCEKNCPRRILDIDPKDFSTLFQTLLPVTVITDFIFWSSGFFFFSNFFFSSLS